MGLHDVHAHLTHGDLASDIAAVLERARAAGLTRIISNGLNLVDNQAVLELCDRFPMVRPALGLYPVDAVLAEMRAAGIDYPREGPEHSVQENLAFLRRHVDRAIAIGEIGLDGYWVSEAFWPRQEEAFRELVKLALDADKPIIVHTRKREQRAFELLEELRAEHVIWHCFGSKVKLAQRIAQKGHYLSIPANARRSEAFTKMLLTLPRRQLLLETDSPYLPPRAGERNEPASVAETANYAAELWHSDLPSVVEQLEDNYRRAFGEAA